MCCGIQMHDASYYRHQAETARRLSQKLATHDVADRLGRMAEDYEDIADDLEKGAVDIRHAELMNQPHRQR